MLDKDKPSILLIIERFYPLIGGAEVQCQQLAVRLLALGYNVVIVTKKWRKEFLRSEILTGNLTVNRLGINGFNRLSDYVGGISLFWYLIRNINKYNILFVDSGLANIFASTGIFLGQVFKKKIIAKPETPGELSFSGENALNSKKFVHPLIKIRLKIAKSADCYLAQTEEIREELVKFGIENQKIFSFPNSVDEELFSPSKREVVNVKKKLGLPEEKILVFFCGRLVARKGLVNLIRAWKEVVSASDKAVLILIGSGENQPDSVENELIRFVTENKIEKSTVFLGCREKELVAKYLKAADIFVYPSIHPEGRAVSVLEAMSCEVPVVVTEIGGLAEIVTDGVNGLLVEKDNIKQLSTGLLKLIGNRKLREDLGKNGRKEILKTYSLDESVKKMREIINLVNQ